MAVVDPSPGHPVNGDNPIDATVVLNKFNALFQGIQSFDASQVQAGTIVEAGLANAVNPRLRYAETGINFVASGGTAGTPSGLGVTLASGVAYIGGNRVVFSSQAFTVSANQDTYVFLNNAGTWSSNGVANNASSFALPANSILMGIIVSGASITSVNQGSVDATAPTVSSNVLRVSDSNGVRIYPTNPNGGLIGYRKILANQGSITTATDITGLNLAVIVPTGRSIRVTFRGLMFTTASGAQSQLLLVETATILQTAQIGQTTGSVAYTVHDSVTLTPTAGVHTYKIQALVSAGTGTVQGDPTYPTFISVELV